MDLIYTDADRKDVGVLKNYTLDLAFGADENDFELTLDVNDYCCQANCLLYIEGTEYGGIVDRISVVTNENKLSYKGRTWQGVLASKVIEPTHGSAYSTVTGEANKVLGTMVERLGLSDLFTNSTADSGLTVDNYSFDRYTDGYSGICKMLANVSGKLHFEFQNGKVILSALPIVDYSKDEQFDSDQLEMTVEKTYNRVNHLICLGSGELTERQVIHLYVDAEGRISEKRSFGGLKEIVGVYDYPNVESLDELRKEGVEYLKSLASEDAMSLYFTPEEYTYDVGDIVGAKEVITGLYTTARISKKIVTINQGMVNVEYKVGE